jgi:hypothetical protein
VPLMCCKIKLLYVAFLCFPFTVQVCFLLSMLSRSLGPESRKQMQSTAIESGVEPVVGRATPATRTPLQARAVPWPRRRVGEQTHGPVLTLHADHSRRRSVGAAPHHPDGRRPCPRTPPRPQCRFSRPARARRLPGAAGVPHAPPASAMHCGRRPVCQRGNVRRGGSRTSRISLAAAPPPARPQRARAAAYAASAPGRMGRCRGGGAGSATLPLASRTGRGCRPNFDLMVKPSVGQFFTDAS